MMWCVDGALKPGGPGILAKQRRCGSAGVDRVAFIRRPPPELAILPLDAERITAQLVGRRFPRSA
jgi:hypothetical protein